MSLIKDTLKIFNKICKIKKSKKLRLIRGDLSKVMTDYPVSGVDHVMNGSTSVPFFNRGSPRVSWRRILNCEERFQVSVLFRRTLKKGVILRENLVIYCRPFTDPWSRGVWKWRPDRVPTTVRKDLGRPFRQVLDPNRTS